MTRLTTVELRRLFSRRLVVLAMLGGLAVTVLMLVATWNAAQPMSAAERAEAETFYQQAVDDWEEYGEEQVAQCEADEAAEAERTGEAVDFGCDQMAPQREWFFRTSPPLHETLPGQLGVMSYLLVFLALLAGATFTAAEFATGAMSNWLTFEPRRGRVYGSKLLAAGLGLVPLALVVLAVLTAGAWVVHDSQGLAEGMTGERWAEAGWTSARIVLLVVLAAVVGAALGVLLRHTAAVLGLAVGYLVVVEVMFAGFFSAFQPWLVLTNLEGWTQQGTTYFLQECTTDASGTMCEMTERALGFGHSAAYVLALTALVVTLGVLTFRRRDAA